MRKEKKNKLWIITEHERLHNTFPFWKNSYIAVLLHISESTLYRVLEEDIRKVKRQHVDIV